MHAVAIYSNVEILAASMLTDDQRRRVHENRQRALLKLQTLTTSKKVAAGSSSRTGCIENASTDNDVTDSVVGGGLVRPSETAASSTTRCFDSNTLSDDDAICLKALEESELALSTRTSIAPQECHPFPTSEHEVLSSGWTSSQEEALSRAVEVAEEHDAAAVKPPHPTCPYCRTLLHTVGQLYECRNEASHGVCCYSQRWPWPHFVDLELVSTGCPHNKKAPCTDNKSKHASFRITLTKVSSTSVGVDAGTILTSISSGLASSLSRAHLSIPEALVAAIPTPGAPASSFVLPLEAYETTLKHLHASSMDKAGVMVRPIPRGYLSLARALHRKPPPSPPPLPQQQQSIHEQIQGTHHQSVPQRPRERFSLVDDAIIMECMSRVPSRLMATLYPYQRAGLVYALRRWGRILLADEMGCGKTLQAIALIATALEQGPVLVLCPAVVRPMWMFELDKWLDSSCSGGGNGDGVAALRGIEGQFDAWHDPADRWRSGSSSSVTVTSYAMLRHLPEMASWRWALVVRWS